MQWLRFRFRSVMNVIALVAIALGGWSAYRLASISASYATMAKAMRSMVAGFRVQVADPRTSPEIKSDFLREAEEMEEVARIYERAASRPRLPVFFKPRSL